MSFCAARDMRLLDLACPKARKIPKNWEFLSILTRIEVNDENIYTQTLEKIQYCEYGEFVRVFLEIPLNQ